MLLTSTNENPVGTSARQIPVNIFLRLMSDSLVVVLSIRVFEFWLVRVYGSKFFCALLAGHHFASKGKIDRY
jgi:hypothetical protein